MRLRIRSSHPSRQKVPPAPGTTPRWTHSELNLDVQKDPFVEDNLVWRQIKCQFEPSCMVQKAVCLTCCKMSTETFRPDMTGSINPRKGSSIVTTGTAWTLTLPPIFQLATIARCERSPLLQTYSDIQLVTAHGIQPKSTWGLIRTSKDHGLTKEVHPLHHWCLLHQVCPAGIPAQQRRHYTNHSPLQTLPLLVQGPLDLITDQGNDFWWPTTRKFSDSWSWPTSKPQPATPSATVMPCLQTNYDRIFSFVH